MRRDTENPLHGINETSSRCTDVELVDNPAPRVDFDNNSHTVDKLKWIVFSKEDEAAQKRDFAITLMRFFTLISHVITMSVNASLFQDVPLCCGYKDASQMTEVGLCYAAAGLSGANILSLLYNEGSPSKLHFTLLLFYDIFALVTCIYVVGELHLNTTMSLVIFLMSVMLGIAGFFANTFYGFVRKQLHEVKVNSVTCCDCSFTRFLNCGSVCLWLFFFMTLQFFLLVGQLVIILVALIAGYPKTDTYQGSGSWEVYGLNCSVAFDYSSTTTGHMGTVEEYCTPSAQYNATAGSGNSSYFDHACCSWSH